ITPKIASPIHVPESLPVGSYPIRILGVATEEAQPDRQIVQAQTTLAIGPLTDSWNFVRRPLPDVSIIVTEPFDGRLMPKTSSLKLSRGQSATLELNSENV